MIYSDKWYRRRKSIFKYLLYLICVPTIGYVFMHMLKDSTRGAHDGGFLGMFFGLFIGQVVFTLFFLKTNKLYSFLIGIGLALITILLSFLIMTNLRNLFFPETNNFLYLIKPDPTIDLILEMIFFGTLCFISIALFELINRLVIKKDK